MLSQARAISFEITPSALDGTLLEQDEIKRHRPPTTSHLLSTTARCGSRRRTSARAASTCRRAVRSDHSRRPAAVAARRARGGSRLSPARPAPRVQPSHGHHCPPICRLIWKILHQAIRCRNAGRPSAQRRRKYARGMIRELRSLGHRVELLPPNVGTPAWIEETRLWFGANVRLPLAALVRSAGPRLPDIACQGWDSYLPGATFV
jgi:hypothetical protein